MILMLSLNTQMIQIFIKIFKNTIQDKKQKVILVFDDMIVDMISNNKKLNPVVTELFIRGRKLNASIVFIT